MLNIKCHNSRLDIGRQIIIYSTWLNNINYFGHKSTHKKILAALP